METNVSVQEQLKTQKTKEYSIVLFNDDVNTFEHVANLLVEVCGHDPLQAEQCALIVHHNGRCLVKNGELEVLKDMAELLLRGGLTVEIN